MNTLFALPKVINPHYLLSLRTIQNLPPSSSILVSKDNDLVARHAIKPGFFGRLFGRKVRFKYRILDPNNAQGRKIKPSQVLDAQESRLKIADTVRSHLYSAFDNSLIGTSTKQHTQEQQTLQTFTDHSNDQIAGEILGQRTHHTSHTISPAAPALTGREIKHTLAELGSKIDYLSTQWNRKKEGSDNDFDKTAFIYNATWNVKSPTSNHAQHYQSYHKGKDILTQHAQHKKIPERTQDVTSFKQHMKDSVTTFFQEHQIPDKQWTRRDLFHQFVDRYLNTHASDKHTQQRLMQNVVDHMPSAMAEIGYALQKSPSQDISYGEFNTILTKHFTDYMPLTEQEHELTLLSKNMKTTPEDTSPQKPERRKARQQNIPSPEQALHTTQTTHEGLTIPRTTKTPSPKAEHDDV